MPKRVELTPSLPIPLSSGGDSRMTFIREAPHGRDHLNRKIRRVVARCACGEEGDYLLSSIRRGDTKSCGCEQERLRMKRAALGKRFVVEGEEYLGWGALAEAYNISSGLIQTRVNDLGWSVEQALGLAAQPPWRSTPLARYGISADQWRALWDHQGECCALCSTSDPHSTGSTRGWCLDHDHTSGEVRGILCFSCNTAMAVIDRGPDFVNAALNYAADPPFTMIH